MWIIAGTLILSLGWSSAQTVCDVNSQTCIDNNVALLKTTIDGADNHYYIGGLFGIHEKGNDAYKCSEDLRYRGLQNMMAFFWAIDHFQRNLDLKINNVKVNNDVSIGGVAFDNCLRKEQSIENIMGFEQCKVKPDGVGRRHLMAFVGPDTSSEAIAVGELLKDMQLTSISHAATTRELTDVTNYPFFLRTVPSDKNDALAIAIILKSVIKTRFVQLVYQDDAYGRAGVEDFKMEVAKRNICIVQTISASENPQSIITKLMDKSYVRYVVVFGSASTARIVLRAAELDNPTVKSKPSAKHVLVFLGTSSWSTNTDVLYQTISASNNSIVLSPSMDQSFQENLNAFKKYWKELKPNTVVQTQGVNNKWFVQYWEKEWNCKVNGIGTDKCDLANQKMKDTSIDTYVPFTIIAVQSIIQGVFNAAIANCSGRYKLCSNLMDMPTRGRTLLTKIKGFKAGKQYFDSNPMTGDVSPDFSKYEVFQVVNGKYKKRADWQPNKELNRTSFGAEFDLMYYPGTVCPYPCNECNLTRTTLPPRKTSVKTTTVMTSTTTMDPTEGGKYMFVRFPRNQEMTGASSSMTVERDMKQTRYDIGQQWVIALAVLAGMGVLAVLIFELYIIYRMFVTGHRQQWRTMWLGQLLLFGIFLCYLTLFAYIPVPTKATCGITRFGVGVSYAFCFAVLLVKLMVVLTSKSSESSLLPGDIESSNYLKGIYQVMMFMFAVGVQVVIDTQWLITVPPEAIQVMTNNGTMEWICNHYTWSADAGYLNMTAFVRTEFENHLLSLVYIMFLILITTLLALNAHGIITNHRESIFIGIAAGFSIPIWLGWTLLGGLVKNHKMAHEFGDACIAFGLFLTTTLILFSMFLPKVRQLVNMGVEGIYLEDDRETNYGESFIVPPSYKSRPSSGIYVNSQSMYSEPVELGNGNIIATHMRQPGTSLHGAAYPHLYKKAQSEYAPHSKVLRVTPDLTGRHSEQRKTQSEIGYRSRSPKGTLKRSRYGSQQNLGAL